MFATTRGTVRRNKLSDFAQVNRAGKIAMRLDEGEEIVDVQICTENDDVLLTTANGQCIRFPVTDVRVFKGRDSMGVRGISLGEGDRVISLAILRHIEAESGERAAYLKMRRAIAGETAAEGAERERHGASAERRDGRGDASRAASARNVTREMSADEEIILTLSVERLWQAHLVLRISDHRARRQRHRRHGGQSAQRPARRLDAGRRQRRDHAGDRWRPADPLPGRGHPRRRPRHARRHRLQHGEGEAVVAVERISEEDAARTEADDEPPAPPDEA